MNNFEPRNHPRIGPSSAIPWLSVAVVLIVALGVLAYFRACRSSELLAGKAERTAGHFEAAAKLLPKIAEKFKTGTITHTFSESVPAIAPTNGDVLELAIHESNESFQKSDSQSTLWGLLPLGTTVSEIRVPVTFRYHLRLSDRWRLAAKDHVCVVLAPPVSPSLPPAIHTDTMEKRSANGWARWNKDDNLGELERSLTPELSARAGDPAHQRLVREACRQSTAEFVKKWLLREDYWRDDRFSSVVVIFPDEAKIATDEELEAYSYGPIGPRP